ncbi:glycosyl transferase family 1 [Bacillus sp. FJAT-21352]|nr:glycosyl transferase family 1 [Bacillus sp. FJAT-21352]
MSESTMRVLMTLDGIDVGGTETHVLSLAEEMINKGIGIVIISRGGSLLQSFSRLQCPIYQVPFPYSLPIPADLQEKLCKEIKQIIMTEKITLIHSHQTPSAFLTFQAAKELGIPSIFTVHGTYYPKSELLRVLPLANKIICVSPPIQQFIQKLTDQPTIVIPNGIDTTRYSPSDSSDLKVQLGIPKDSFVLLYSSRIAWTKANICMIFLRACKDLKHSGIPNLYVVVVGGGPRFKEIRDITDTIHRSSTDNFINLVGERLDLQHYYSLADCVVGTGRVALEAMACSKPVIAAGSHGYFGLVEEHNFEDAWHCYFGDHGSLKPCSRYTMANDIRSSLAPSDRLLKAGSASREWMLKKFNIKFSVANLLECYKTLIKG